MDKQLYHIILRDIVVGTGSFNRIYTTSLSEVAKYAAEKQLDNDCNETLIPLYRIFTVPQWQEVTCVDIQVTLKESA